MTENGEVKSRWKEYFRELFDGEEREIYRYNQGGKLKRVKRK